MTVEKSNFKITNSFSSLLYDIFALFTAFIGYNIHGSIFWAIMDLVFVPFVWIKWFIYHEVNLTIIKNSFEFFFK